MAERLAVLLCGALLCAPALADEKSAKAAEDRAFTAVEEERWCDALHGFMAANEAAPSIDLIFNAALAADEAGDHKQALKLYVELLGAYPDSDRGEAVNTRIGELTKKVQAEGEGTPCPEPAATPEPAAAEATEPVDAPPPEDVASVEEASGGGMSTVVPWTVAGIGIGLSVIGVSLSGIGALPYLDFVSTRDAILVAEAESGDVGDLHARQADARAAWETWGEAVVWTGVATAVTGVLVGAGGVIWALAAGGEE